VSVDDFTLKVLEFIKRNKRKLLVNVVKSDGTLKVTTSMIARGLRAHPSKVKHALVKLKESGMIRVVKVINRHWYIRVVG